MPAYAYIRHLSFSFPLLSLPLCSHSHSGALGRLVHPGERTGGRLKRALCPSTYASTPRLPTAHVFLSSLIPRPSGVRTVRSGTQVMPSSTCFLQSSSPGIWRDTSLCSSMICPVSPVSCTRIGRGWRVVVVGGLESGQVGGCLSPSIHGFHPASMQGSHSLWRSRQGSTCVTPGTLASERYYDRSSMNEYTVLH